jgi:hypothetical protein
MENSEYSRAEGVGVEGLQTGKPSSWMENTPARMHNSQVGLGPGLSQTRIHNNNVSVALTFGNPGSLGFKIQYRPFDQVYWFATS